MIREILRSCFDNFRRYRFRTFLTLLAIVVGSFSIVVMTSIAHSGLNTILSGIERIGGSRLIALFPKEPVREKSKASLSPGLSQDDVLLIRERVPFIERVTITRSIGRIELRRRERTSGVITDIVGSDHLCITSLDMGLAAGRGFVEADLHESRRVMIIGDELRLKLFGNSYPVGAEVNLFGATYRIIGCLSRNFKLGVQLGFDWNDFVFIPETTLRDREQIEASLEILITTTAADRNDIVKRIINALLEQRHNGVDDFTILDFHKVLDQFARFFILISAIVAVVSSISLIIGGVGIMNIMLVSINQRMQEIGIRRAVGATPRAIIAQFMSEASILAVVGSILGVLCGLVFIMAAGLLITQFEPSWVSVISWTSVMFALGSALIIGNVFGFFPARRAAGFVIDRCLRAERG